MNKTLKIVTPLVVATTLLMGCGAKNQAEKVSEKPLTLEEEYKKAQEKFEKDSLDFLEYSPDSLVYKARLQKMREYARTTYHIPDLYKLDDEQLKGFCQKISENYRKHGLSEADVDSFVGTPYADRIDARRAMMAFIIKALCPALDNNKIVAEMLDSLDNAQRRFDISKGVMLEKSRSERDKLSSMIKSMIKEKKLESDPEFQRLTAERRQIEADLDSLKEESVIKKFRAISSDKDYVDVEYINKQKQYSDIQKKIAERQAKVIGD